MQGGDRLLFNNPHNAQSILMGSRSKAAFLRAPLESHFQSLDQPVRLSMELDDDGPLLFKLIDQNFIFLIARKIVS